MNNSNVEEIRKKLSELIFSEKGILDLKKLLDLAISINEKQDPNRHSNHCLNNLIQTKEKQLQELMNENPRNRSQQEYLFDATISHFKNDLDFWK